MAKFFAKFSKIHLSRQVWLNVIGAIVLYLNGTTMHFIPQTYVAEALLLCNIIMRFLTNTPMEENKTLL